MADPKKVKVCNAPNATGEKGGSSVSLLATVITQANIDKYESQYSVSYTDEQLYLEHANLVGPLAFEKSHLVGNEQITRTNYLA